MASSYANESMDDRRDLSPEISAACSRLMADVKAASPRTVEKRESTPSPLQQWASSPLVETRGVAVSLSALERHAGDFPLSEKLNEIVDTMEKEKCDVVLVIAPTGAGKSIQAPLIAEKLARCSESGKRFRKTILAVPSGEHCGSTARTFGALFNDSGIKLSAFHNPYDERICMGDGDTPKLMKLRNSDSYSAEFVVSPYTGVIRVLPGASLNLLIVDECHEPNTNVQVVISMAVKMMNAELPDPNVPNDGHPTLNHLLLMTATMDDEEKNNLERFVTEAGRSFKILDYSKRLDRNKTLKMSCIDGSPLPEMFEAVPPLSTSISKALNAKARSDSPDNIELTTRLQIAMDCVMEHATSDLRSRIPTKGRNKEYDMRSIIIINAGQEQVDKMHTLARNSPHFKFGGGDGFHLVRMTSLVKDDPSITTECDWKGKWQPEGNKGRIVNTTNFVASGLTVPNAAYVIDCGKQKIPAIYTRNGLTSLETIDIDRQMMMQRAGRTGRTTDGVYVLPYSVEKVKEMVNGNHGMLLRNRNFEERHFLLQKLHGLKLPHKPPSDLKDELFESFETRGLISEAEGFDKDTLLMHSLMNFLSTENARIIIQGVRFGITAHVVYLVADSLCKGVRFCQHGTAGRGKEGGPSVDKSAIHLYAEAMDDMEGGDRRAVGHGMGNLAATELPEKYEGVGDSIALADLLVSYHIVEGAYPPEANFWGGKRAGVPDTFTFKKLEENFAREEGRCNLLFYVGQITRNLIGIGMIPANNKNNNNILFDKNLNRHIVSTDNYCLNQDGRALLSALLTMHSSRVGKLDWKTRQGPVYEIYCAQAAVQNESLYPEATYTQPVLRRGEKMYGRYAEIGKRHAKYAGMIDPISVKQLAFFININGNCTTNLTEHWVKFDLNASTGTRGILIRAESWICKGVKEVRKMLNDGLRLLTNTEDKNLIADLEKFIIKLWRECENVKEDPLSTPPPPPYSRYANGSDDRPRTARELKERDARGNGRY